MKVKFIDLEDENSPARNQLFEDADSLLAQVESANKREPFFCQLEADNGYKLLLGLGPTEGCAQYSKSSDSPPYLMALGNNNTNTDQSFLISGSATPVKSKYLLSIANVKEIADCFLESGKTTDIVQWEEI